MYGLVLPHRTSSYLYILSIHYDTWYPYQKISPQTTSAFAICKVKGNRTNRSHQRHELEGPWQLWTLLSARHWYSG
jgi:hypothetical protein